MVVRVRLCQTITLLLIAIRESRFNGFLHEGLSLVHFGRVNSLKALNISLNLRGDLVFSRIEVVAGLEVHPKRGAVLEVARKA